MAEHKYAQVLRWIADGEKIQVDVNGWTTCSAEGVLRHILTGTHNRFRLAPRTIIVNGVEVPAPEMVAPERGVQYLIPSLSKESLYRSYVWYGGEFDKQMLDRDLVYLTPSDAIARAKAMLITKEM